MATEFQKIIEALARESVEFVIIGGVALVVHGSSRSTEDLDVCYSRSPANLEAITRALAPLHSTLRGAPKDLPFRLDVPTLRAGLN